MHGFACFTRLFNKQIFNFKMCINKYLLKELVLKIDTAIKKENKNSNHLYYYNCINLHYTT